MITKEPSMSTVSCLDSAPFGRLCSKGKRGLTWPRQSACLACVNPVFGPQHCIYQVRHTPYSGTPDVEAEIKAIFGYIGNSRST